VVFHLFEGLLYLGRGDVVCVVVRVVFVERRVVDAVGVVLLLCVDFPVSSVEVICGGLCLFVFGDAFSVFVFALVSFGIVAFFPSF